MGSFTTVLLCDWHSTLPPDLHLPAMQHAVKQEWKDKRLVVVKQFRGWRFNNWTECQRTMELKVGFLFIFSFGGRRKIEPMQRYSGLFLFIRISSLCMMRFLTLHLKHSTSYSSQWKAIYTTYSRSGEADRLRVAW